MNNNKINFEVKTNSGVSITCFIDGEKKSLEVNPNAIFSVLVNARVSFFLGVNKKELKENLSISFDDNYVYWSFPEKDVFHELSAKAYVFDKLEYVEAVQQIIYDLVLTTTALNNVNRQEIKVLESNLSEFIITNREKISEALSVELES